MKKKICAFIAVCCLIWILGLAGASDNEAMSFGSIVAQAMIALPGLIISFMIGGFYK